MTYKVLFTDLDGTLLNNHLAISAVNKRAIAQAQTCGKKIILCSGRSWMSLASFEQALDLHKPGCYSVAFNGGTIYQTNPRQFLCDRTMPNALGQTIMRLLKAMDADIMLYVNHQLLVDRPTTAITQYRKQSGIPLHIVDDLTAQTDDITKVLIKGENARLQAIYAAAQQQLANDCQIVFSSDDLLEFAPPGVHKGQAVAYLSQYLQIPTEEMIAVGDQCNDMEMIQTAGLGIAVANAVPMLKEQAQYVTAATNDENAVSEVIYKYLLNE